MTYKKYCMLIGFICLLMLSAVAYFNYTFDPAHLFGKSQYEAGMVSILLAGKNVANISNYDERLLQKYYIENDTRSKQIIVLGSSRMMLIRESNFPGQTFFNLGVSGSTLEDYLSIFEIYLQKGYVPKTVIIGLDPWLLNKNHNQTRWQSLHDDFLTASRRLGLKTNTGLSADSFFEFRKYKELISLSYLEASYLRLRKKSETKDINYYPTDKEESNVPIKLMDGSISYEPSYRNHSVEEVRKLALNYANSNPIYSLGDFNTLDPEYQNMFDAFVNDLCKRGVKVIFFLTPYHPVVYSAIANDQKYQMVLSAQRYFEEYAHRKGIKIIGSYNPADCKLNERDFYDGMHLKKSAIDKMLRAAD